MIEIQYIGFYAQLVDKGRRLSSHLGFASTGALDWQSYELANSLVGNTSGLGECSNVSIEITLGDVHLKFQQSTIIALTGASAQCDINNQPCSMYSPVFVPAGSILTITNIGANQHGVRVYLAVRGVIDVPCLFASASNVKREGSGGLFKDGSSLKAGDALALRLVKVKDKQCLKAVSETQKSLQQNFNKLVENHLNQLFSGNSAVAFMPSYQWPTLPPVERMRLLTSWFSITPDFDRMGMRLQGHPIQLAKRQLYSQGLCNGAIQCAGDGQLIIMLNDRQTIGGYPVLGAVDAYSRAKLAQKIPGDTLTFELCDHLNVAASVSIFTQQMKNLATWVDKRLTS